jgi:hypothetical protein
MQDPKAPIPIYDKDSGNSTLFIATQLPKAESPIFVKDELNFAVVKFLQPLKADAPISVTEFGIVRDVSSVQL